MRYVSTRDNTNRVSASGAIVRGLSRDGGLYVPEVLPQFSKGAIRSLCDMNYHQRAVYILGSFLDEYSASELTAFVERAYSFESFDSLDIAPVHKLDARTFFLELWHGPTCAFKDMALQLLPQLLTSSLKKQGENKRVIILAATSGDTGKAAMEGFADVEGTGIMTFYPAGGVSEMQELQMTTQEGRNIYVCAVRGNFDDTQSGVKGIFSNEALRQELNEAGMFLSSANSINWGRLVAQIVYYFSAYCDMVKSGGIDFGDTINFCVPTGNFGNILAGWYAKRMGLPVGKLICASNENNVLTDFIRTGVYDRRRDFKVTLSPSMDILVSSNLERLLYDVAGQDDTGTAGLMAALAETGCYRVSESFMETLQRDFYAACCDDERTKRVIRGVYRYFDYLIDPHTAVAYDALNTYRIETGDETPAAVIATASPYKFVDAVLQSLGESAADEPWQRLARLSELTDTVIPTPLVALRGRERRFKTVIEVPDMERAVRAFCGLR